MKFLDRKADWQLSILSGILIGIAYPPLHAGFLAWFGLVPLIRVLLRVSPREGARYGYLTGITAHIIALYWIGFNSGAGFGPVFASLVAAILYLGLFWGLFGWVLAWIQRKMGLGFLAFPFLWVAMEYLRSFGPLGFPWINLALTQTEYIPLIQIAEYTGTYGVGFWLALVNSGLAMWTMAPENRKTITVYTGIIFFSMWILGGIRYLEVEHQVPGKEFSVSVVQPNLDPNEKWESSHRKRNIALMDSLLDVSIGQDPDLILWPETAVPVYLRLTSSVRRPIQKKIFQSNIPLLSGTVDRLIDEDGEKHYYNGSILLSPDGEMEMYYKIHLVPFAEYIPLSESFPILKKLNFGQGNFSMGKEYTVFTVDSTRFSNFICYESSIPQVVRGFVRNGAQFLTIEANDGWLGNTSGPYQHFELARLRAVEFRLPIVRSANTGISGIINPSGRVKRKIPIGRASVFKDFVPISDFKSMYARLGDSFAGLCLIIILFILGKGWLNRSS